MSWWARAFRKAHPTLCVIGITKDRRTPEQIESARKAKQDAEDLAMERLWRSRVEDNIIRREAAKERLKHECRS